MALKILWDFDEFQIHKIQKIQKIHKIHKKTSKDSDTWQTWLNLASDSDWKWAESWEQPEARGAGRSIGHSVNWSSKDAYRQPLLESWTGHPRGVARFGLANHWTTFLSIGRWSELGPLRPADFWQVSRRWTEDPICNSVENEPVQRWRWKELFEIVWKQFAFDSKVSIENKQTVCSVPPVKMPNLF